MKNLRLPEFLITVTMKGASRLGAAIAPFLVDGKRVERFRDLFYGSGPNQLLDVYLPRNRPLGAKLPVALFIHGGGFRFFSKDSHAAAAARLAYSGRIVFCIDYRLSPQYPFPEGLVDVAYAYEWMIENAHRFGGDLERVSLIGESSGAGFIASLCLYLFGILSFPSAVLTPKIPAVKPKAAILHCGYFEVSDIDRFREDLRCHPLARTRIAQIRKNYLPTHGTAPAEELALADPLVALAAVANRGGRLPEGFPEIFIPVGERDPVIGDSERMAAVLEKLGQGERLKVYPGVGHAFYAAPGGKQAKVCWDDIVAFLDRHRA